MATANFPSGKYTIRANENIYARCETNGGCGFTNVSIGRNNQFTTYVDKYGKFSIETLNASFIGMFSINDKRWQIIGGPYGPSISELYPDLRSNGEMGKFVEQHALSCPDWGFIAEWYDRNKLIYSCTCCACGEVAIASIPYIFCTTPLNCMGYGTCQHNNCCTD